MKGSEKQRLLGGGEKIPSYKESSVGPSSFSSSSSSSMIEQEDGLDQVREIEIDQGEKGLTERFGPFMRRPTHSLPLFISLLLRLVEFILSIFLIPLRILAAFLLWFLVYIACLIATIGLEDPETMSIKRPRMAKMVRMVVVMTSRTCLFLMGFFWIPVDDQRKKEITKDGGCFGQVSTPLKTSVIVSNHLSFMDIMVLASKCDAPSFVAKHSVKSVFLVGRVACCLGSLFVDLSKKSQDPSQSLSQQIISRQHFFDHNPGIPSLVIFPEGTTTNGSAIVQFRKGAFLAGHPVQIVCFKYTTLTGDSLSWETIPVPIYGFLLLRQLIIRCHIKFLPVYIPSEAEQQDPALFAHNVQKEMAKGLNVAATNHTREDKLEYHRMIIEGKVKWNTNPSH